MPQGPPPQIRRPARTPFWTVGRVALASAALAGLAVLATLGGPGITVDEPLDVRPGRTYVETLRREGLGFFRAETVRRVFADNAEHPPLGRWLLGVASTLGEPFEPILGGPDPFGVHAGRLAPAACFAALVGLVALAAGRRYGRAGAVGAAAGLVMMPRVFAHAHLGALDTFLALFWIAALLAADRALAGPRPVRAMALAGAVWGLALLTKIHAWLLPPIVVALAGHWWFYGRPNGANSAGSRDRGTTSGTAGGAERGAARTNPTPGDTPEARTKPIPGRPLAARTDPIGSPAGGRTDPIPGARTEPTGIPVDDRTEPIGAGRLAAALLAWAAAGLAVYLAGWPWLWYDGVERLRAYLGTGLDRISIQVQYFGQVFADRDVPWHYPWLYFAATVPPGLHALGVLGLIRGFLGRRADPLPMALAGAIGMFLVLFSTKVPVYDGERLFLVAFPAWAVLVGGGFGWAWDRLRRPWMRGLLAAALASQAAGLVATHPFGLSYYNAFVGGLPGAERLGLELTYWGDAVDRVLLDRLAREARPGQSVAFAPTLHHAQAVAWTTPALAAKRLRLLDESAVGSADWVVLFRRSAYWRPEARELAGRGPPILARSRSGVWLSGLFRGDSAGSP